MRIGKVCFPTYGGSGAVAGELAKGLAERGHMIHIISSELPFRLKTFTRNIVFHEVSSQIFAPITVPQYVLSLASRIIEICQEYAIEVLHLHYAVPHATSGFLARSIMGDKSPVLITTLHGTDITLVGSHPSFFPITKFSIEQSDGVTSVSNYLKRTTHEVFTIEKDIRVIYNFIDTEKYVPRTAEDLKCNFCSREEKVLMHISNFRPVKRVMDVVDIFYEVQKEVNCRLVLIGDGEDRAAAIRSAWNRGLSDRVIFLGKQDNVEDLIPMADVFLFPSANESFGLAALEALSCGVPVVGTRSGGLPEVVEDGRCGYLHPVGAVKEMAASVIELLNNRERMEEFRSNARNRAVENFNQKTIITHYERYYEEVVNAKRAKV